MKFGKLELKNLTKLFLAAVAVTLFIGCSDDDSEEQTAQVMVRMTDAPGDYDAVLVDVKDVMIKASETGDEEEGWVSLGNVEARVYDLLELTGGVTALLANSEVPAGYYTQMRLVLGNNNNVIINGETQPLSTPSAQQSGLKLQLNQELEAGEEYEFLLDFDVDRSIVTAGSAGGFILKPVIRMTAIAQSGMIRGEVHPTTNQSLITATNATTTISAYTDANGAFVLNGVPAGTYKVTIIPAAASNLPTKIVSDVVVSAGATVDLETVFLE